VRTILTHRVKLPLVLGLIPLLIGIACSQSANPSGLELRRAPLTGLKGVVVTIEPSERLSKTGLTIAGLTSEVESELRENGVSVLTDFQQEQGALYVGVNVLMMPGDTSFSYNINVEVWQAAALVRNPQQSLIATTWSSGSIGFAGRSTVKDAIRKVIEDHVGDFITDYRAVNPQ